MLQRAKGSSDDRFPGLASEIARLMMHPESVLRKLQICVHSHEHIDQLALGRMLKKLDEMVEWKKHSHLQVIRVKLIFVGFLELDHESHLSGYD